MKHLIISADDFGLSRVFNRRMLELVEFGFITSVSVLIDMASQDQEEHIQNLIRFSELTNISVGLHVDFRDENFLFEITRQVALFQDVFSFLPHHMNIHKIFYMSDGYQVIQDYSKANGLPCRNLSSFEGCFMRSGIMTTREPIFDGSRKSFEDIERWIGSLRDNDYYEIVFHPGVYDSESGSSLNRERETDAQHIIQLQTIFSTYQVQLASYRDLVMFLKK